MDQHLPGFAFEQILIGVITRLGCVLRIVGEPVLENRFEGIFFQVNVAQDGFYGFLGTLDRQDDL
ncbi:hypothetical protein [Candidatus Villigracilis saccharophilus]|uniref:hypothetical protein n=1 Tax=Candidatus Villigracilis saccharophilus TaxID=3140684 RepID=UPI0031EAF276